MTQELKNKLTGDSKELIAFIVNNNFPAVRAKLVAKKLVPITSLPNAAAAIVTIDNLYKSGFDVSDLLSVSYIDTATDYTGGLIKEYKPADGTQNKDWTPIVIPVVTLLASLFGGSALINGVLGNSQGNPPPTPSDVQGATENNTMLYVLLGVIFILVCTTGYGLAKKNKTVWYISLPLLVIVSGYLIYDKYNAKKPI